LVRRLFHTRALRKRPRPDAASAARILREIRMTIEGGELEQRIERLEASLGAAKPNGSNGGYDRPGLHL
jgi:hypothetical protein